MDTELVEWNVEDMLEVSLTNENNFLKIKETLTRMGYSSANKKLLFQSCHILQKRGKFYIMQFKELFALDGKRTNLTKMDIMRRNVIALLLQQWKLIKIESEIPDDLPFENILKMIEIISFKEKKNWTLIAKYRMGKNE